jgi:putative ABC transport system ATP-binding protein
MGETGIIDVEEVRRHFKVGEETVRALDGVTLTIQQGEFFGISGSSGSGKSTLLYLLGGMDRPTSGFIRVRGKDISRIDENELAVYRKKTVGFIYQSFHLVPAMTALQNVELPMVFSRIDKRARRERAAQLLEMMGLANRTEHRPTELSGGQRQRVAIARALANSPIILIADEPTGNLDSKNGAEVIAMLKKLNEEEGITVLIVSHDQAVIQETHRYIRMHDGRVAEEVQL